MVVRDMISFQERLDVLHEDKLRQTREKQQIIGSMDNDDQGRVLPPPEVREVVQAISGSTQPT